MLCMILGRTFLKIKTFTSVTEMKLITFEKQSNGYGIQTACNVKVLRLTTFDFFYDL